MSRAPHPAPHPRQRLRVTLPWFKAAGPYGPPAAARPQYQLLVRCCVVLLCCAVLLCCTTTLVLLRVALPVCSLTTLVAAARRRFIASVCCGVAWCCAAVRLWVPRDLPFSLACSRRRRLVSFLWCFHCVVGLAPYASGVPFW